jgi:hypothetical protein
VTIDEAIEIFQADIDCRDFVDSKSLREAEKLGTEALKRVKHIRETYQKTSYVLLPGETEK